MYSFNGSDVIVMFDGEKLGELQTFNADISNIPENKEIKNGDNMKLFNREYSMTLENVQINPDFVGNLINMNTAFTVKGTGYKLPRGNKLSKKKRLRKKWMKRYSYDFEFDNCKCI